MHKREKGRSTIRVPVLLCLCLMISLLWNVMTVSAVELDRPDQLTVTAVDQNSDYSKDIAQASIVYDLYQLADAQSVSGVDTYSYAFKAPYDTITIEGIALSQINLNGVSLSNEQWSNLGQQAMEMAVQRTPDKTVEPADGISGTFTELPAGLYLVLAHSKDLDPYYKTNDKGEEGLVTIAVSPCFEYTFAPAVVSLPTKEAQIIDGVPVINTAQSFGEWIYEAQVYLKPNMKPLYGGVQITKTIDQFDGTEPATFVFQITATGEFPDNAEYEYRNVAAITFDPTTGFSNTAIVSHIRAGAQVTVEEIYSGPRYDQGSVTAPESTVIVAEEGNELQFTATNTQNDSENGGHGIQNHYENVQNSQDGNSHWVGPADPDADAPAES